MKVQLRKAAYGEFYCQFQYGFYFYTVFLSLLNSLGSLNIKINHLAKLTFRKLL